MKKIFLLLSIILVSCSNDKNDQQSANKNDQQTATKNTIIGRWHLVGFEQTVMYEFTATERHTIYGVNGTFGDITSAIPNPNPWKYEGANLAINLFFGNSSVSTPTFKCNGNVVNLVSANGTTTLFREGYNINNCNE
jgi:hypothetical protein